MRTWLGALAVIGLLAAPVTGAAAQDDDDSEVAAWFGMMFTPFGALPPIASPMMRGTPRVAGSRASAFELRYGHWDLEGEETYNNFGLGGHFGPVGLVVGYGKCEGCDDGYFLALADFEASLMRSVVGTGATPSSFAIGIRPSVGVGVPTGDDDGSALSANVELPLSFSMPVGAAAGHLVPFVAPGFGWGRVSDEDESDSGTRASVAAGVSYFLSAGFGVHLSWRKIFLEEAPSTLGLGISFGR